MQFTKKELDLLCEDCARQLDDDQLGRKFRVSVDAQYTLSVVLRVTQVAGSSESDEPYYTTVVPNTKVRSFLDSRREADEVTVTFTAEELKLLQRVLGLEEGKRNARFLVGGALNAFTSLNQKLTQPAAGYVSGSRDTDRLVSRSVPVFPDLSRAEAEAADIDAVIEDDPEVLPET